jgi:hypothetical protein
MRQLGLCIRDFLCGDAGVSEIDFAAILGIPTAIRLAETIRPWRLARVRRHTSIETVWRSQSRERRGLDVS